MNKAAKYITEVKAELQKATWSWDPKEKGLKKYKQLIDSTIIVLIAMVLLAAFISVWDFVMQYIVRFLTTELFF